MSLQGIPHIKQQLRQYKKRYYVNTLIRGVIICISALTAAYLAVTTLEYMGQFDSTTRSVLAYSFLGVAGYSLFRWIGIPTKQLLNLDNELSDIDASRQIGLFFPEIKDKLINTLQLNDLNTQSNSLVTATITQRTNELSTFSFSSAVDYSENKNHAKRYLIIPILALLTIAVTYPQIFTLSTQRLVNYNQEFVENSPFTFNLISPEQKIFRGDDHEVKLQLKGDAIPVEVIIEVNGHKRRMKETSPGEFTYTISGVQHDQRIQFSASGYNSETHLLSVVDRPNLKSMNLTVEYPTYLHKSKSELKNIGSLVVPEGTQISWELNTSNATKAEAKFELEEGKVKVNKTRPDQFVFSKQILQSQTYSIFIENQFSTTKDKLEYKIDVIKDEFPSIKVEQHNDTILYSNILLGGTIQDDYGLTSLQAFYRYVDGAKSKAAFQTMRIPIQSDQTSQSFVYRLALDSLKIQPGGEIEYYLQVWDNDGINGFKSTKSRMMTFEMASKEELEERIDNASANTEKNLESAMENAESLKKDFEKLTDKLKTKKELDWQDKKDLEKMVERHEQMQNDLEQLQQEFDMAQEQVKKFNEPDQDLANKMEQLNKLMESLMDEETKKMMEELEKLLQDEAELDKINEKLEDIDDKNENLEKELDRAIEMFKKMEFDRKLDETIEKLQDLSEEQQELSEETKEKDSNPEELQKQQEELNKEFDDVKKDMEELNKMNEDLEQKNDMGDLNEEQKDVDSQQQEAKESLEQGKKKKASESQKEASESMKEMAEKMSDMQQQSQQSQQAENMDDLRDILENLITLSFDQEKLMKEFKSVRQSDPRFVTLSQEQLKLKDDAHIIEDSLYALAKRVFEIESFVTREVTEMKQHMDDASDALKIRKPSQASGKQQYAMTSMNNLALLLNDVLKQMQEQAAQQMEGQQMCDKPGSSGKPKLSDMQKQINQMLQDIKNGKKGGRQLSEQLAKLAARQEMIRRGLKEMEGENGTKPGDKLSELQKIMEETEKDIVNKNITHKTVQRQQDILTRLLEAEKASREREYDNKRESKTGQELERDTPPEFDKYLKEKEKQIELLKTIPPSLRPYYKKEVHEYFQSIEN